MCWILWPACFQTDLWSLSNILFVILFSCKSGRFGGKQSWILKQLWKSKEKAFSSPVCKISGVIQICGKDQALVDLHQSHLTKTKTERGTLVAEGKQSLFAQKQISWVGKLAVERYLYFLEYLQLLGVFAKLLWADCGNLANLITCKANQQTQTHTKHRVHHW